jgi:ABC-type transport system substrate-binding protein
MLRIWLRFLVGRSLGTARRVPPERRLQPGLAAPQSSPITNRPQVTNLPHKGRIVVGAIVFAAVGFAETRPRYGGTLRVELHDSFETADPPQTGPSMASLARAFNIVTWEGGHRAVFAADENAAGGRPFVDSVEIQLARPLRDQSIDLELGKTDIVELGPNEIRRQQPGRKTWQSQPVRVMALVFSRRVEDVRVREALALAVDRSAILTVLLQRQGEISGALLPQWLSGYAFLFPALFDLPRARMLAAGARPLSLSVADAGLRAIADRIALNARDAGLTVNVVAQNSAADIRLVETRIAVAEPSRALAGLAAAFGLSEPPRADTPDALYAAEHNLLEGFRVVPLFHLPDVYGAGPRVKGSPGITKLGEWRFGDLWIESLHP